MKTFVLWLALAAPAAYGQSAPFVFRGGIVNAASFTSNDLPGGGIALGSIFTIFGRRLGPATAVQVSAFPLDRQLAGVSIILRQGATRLSAIPLYVVEGQINALLPSGTPLGDVSLQVSFNGQSGNWAPLRVVAHAPGVFTSTGLGRGWATFQNYVSATAQPLNSGLNAVAPGQIGTLWLTGSGPITGSDSDTPPVGDLPYGVEIYIGGRPVTRKLYSGRAPGFAGLDQYVFYVPDDAPSGCFVPVYVRVAGAVSNATTIAVMPHGGACVDAQNPISAAFTGGGKQVEALFFRASTGAGEFAGVDLPLAVDKATIRAVLEGGGGFAFDPYLALPPPGACTSYSARGNLLVNGAQISSAGRALDLGTLVATANDRMAALTALQPGLFVSALGGGDPSATPFFGAATPNLHATGGGDAVAFEVPVTSGATLAGASLAALTAIDRSTSATVSWTPRSGVSAVVAGAVYDQPSNSSALFLCVSAPGAGSLTVPDYALANLPVVMGAAGKGDARLSFGALPALAETDTADQVRIFAARQDFSVQAIHSIR